MPYKIPEPQRTPIDPKVLYTVEARWRGGEPLSVTTKMMQLDLEQVQQHLLDRGYKQAQDRWNTRHCGVPENDPFGPVSEEEHEKLEKWLEEQVKSDPKLQMLLNGVENSNMSSLLAARRLFAERNPVEPTPEPAVILKSRWLEPGTKKTKVIDNDVDEVRVEFDGRDIRSWTYATEDERRKKMGLAHEFAEGFYRAQVLAQPSITSDPALGTDQLREDLETLRDRIKVQSPDDADLLTSAMNRLKELSAASRDLLGPTTAGDQPKPPVKRQSASSDPSL